MNRSQKSGLKKKKANMTLFALAAESSQGTRGFGLTLGFAQVTSGELGETQCSAHTGQTFH